MSEKGRMINIICIIIFFILSHLSPSPDPRHGVRQGGPSSGQPVTSGSVWRAKPGGWQVEGGQSSSLLPSLHQDSFTMEWVGFSQRWWEPASCFSQREASASGSAWHKAPFWEGSIPKVSGTNWSTSSQSVPWNSTGVGSSSPCETLLAGLEAAGPYIVFWREVLIVIILTYNKAIFSLSYSLAMNCFYVEIGFIYSAQ